MSVSCPQIEVIPCDDKGKEYTEADNMFCESSQELNGKNVSFVFKIVSARGLPDRFTVSIDGDGSRVRSGENGIVYRHKERDA